MQLNVVVDDVSDAVDELDDQLGHVVARRSLAAKEDGTRHNIGALGFAHRLDLAIAIDDRENVEQLTLVLVEALDVDVEQHGVRINTIDATNFKSNLGQALLVFELDLTPKKSKSNQIKSNQIRIFFIF